MVERNKSGIATGCVGIAVNLLLGLSKLVVGILSGSVSIVSDAANNLSDAGSSVVTVASFALGARGADKDHPYGHGRYEYIANLLIGAIIIVVGVQLAITSIEKIIAPTQVEYDTVAIAILAVSIAVKAALGVFYVVRGKKIKSDMVKAVAFDSFSDAAVTSGLLVTVVLSRFIAYPTEGIVGLIISAVIAVGGVKILLSTVNRLLGRGGDRQTEENLTALILSGDLVEGVHDLRIHDYGPNRMIATAHAEMRGEVSVLEAHAVLDAIEDEAKSRYGVELVIHCDPIDRSDVTLSRLRRAVKGILDVYTGAKFHDLDVHYDEKRVAVHVELPENYTHQADSIRARLVEAVGEVVDGYAVDVTMDYEYNA